MLLTNSQNFLNNMEEIHFNYLTENNKNLNVEFAEKNIEDMKIKNFLSKGFDLENLFNSLKVNMKNKELPKCENYFLSLRKNNNSTEEEHLTFYRAGKLSKKLKLQNTKKKKI